MTARPDHERETVTIPRSEYEALRAAASATGFLWYQRSSSQSRARSSASAAQTPVKR